MGIQTEWRLAELDADSDDPFDAIVRTTGLSVDLKSDDLGEIEAGIRRTLRIEGALDAQSITCDLKDGGQDCLTCTAFTTDSAEPRAPLCALGRDQGMLVRRADQLNAARRRPYVVLAGYHAADAALAAHASRGLIAA